ncbi:MAG: hypothetical protein HYX32_13580 [Actinobacteria bacterium]|nr:hypothetical protein [Actinomycetota bacterium]
MQSALAGNPDFVVTDAQASIGLEAYIAVLATVSSELSSSQLAAIARSMSASDVQSTTVDGRPAARFKTTQNAIDFDAIVIGSGTRVVILMGGTFGTGEVQFDRFVNSLQLN